MAFNADEYIGVIVEQIGGNFSELERAVEHCPNLKKAIKEYRDLQNKEDFLIFKKPSELKLREASTKVEIYQQSIGDLVCDEYRTVEPLSVGLFGEWGSGKTHLLKLIESRINQLQSNPLKNEEDIFPHTTIPIFFNAWRFEKEEHLIIPLFQTMLAQLEAYERFTFNDKRKKITKSLWREFKVLSMALVKGLQKPEDVAIVMAKVANHDVTAVADVVDLDKVKEGYTKDTEALKKEQNYKQKLKELLNSERLESIYYQIPEWIEKLTLYENINFVFLIDDLDRCLPENTLKMLESIKLFLDVPSCAFVLAIDDDVVERGVEHHYRDYLKDIVRHELPITGHEYLEKMIQLPFRIPVIDTRNIREFLEENYFDKIFARLDDKQEEQKKSTQIIEFFSKTIPPKPRKIKRTAMLFDTKLKIYDKLKAEHKLNLPLNEMLLAKITLLELFSPKLLRFIQNNGYQRIYNRLGHFRGVDQEGVTELLSLTDRKAIDKHIEDENYTPKEKQLFKRLLDIVNEGSNSRMVFDLDTIFDKLEKSEDLKVNIELRESPKKDVNEPLKEVTTLSDIFWEKLFRENDETSWRDAFDDNELFEEGKALLSDEQLSELSQRARGKKGFSDNPKWLLIIAEYITQEQFIKFLEEIYPYQMNPYQTTFEEYDKYCEATGAKKTSDNKWGRGKRPVINVNWEDVTSYAKWLSEKEGVEYRLPTSDEWYLACNVGAKTKWHFGDNEKELKDYAWYSENSDGKTHPVGELKPNALGLYDMHGNVWEWCDSWDDSKKEAKVLRGGSKGNHINGVESSFLYWGYPNNCFNLVGFRLLKTLP